MARIFHHPRFQFWSASHVAGEVDLQIFRRSDDYIVAVISERVHEGRQSPQGASATDGIAQIATQIVTDLGIHFDTLIEHYPQHGQLLDLARSKALKRETPEQFYVIALRWSEADQRYVVDPSGGVWAWKQISRAAAEQIIGEPFSASSSQLND